MMLPEPRHSDLPAEIDRDRNPRQTRLWQNHWPRVLEAFAEALTDPEIRRRWVRIKGISLVRALTSSPNPSTEEQVRELVAGQLLYDEVMPDLVKAFRERAPDLAHMFGPRLPELIAVLMIDDLNRAETDQTAIVQHPDNVWRIFRPYRLPGNPIVLEDPKQGIDQADDTRHFLELRNYHASFRPEGKPGPRAKRKKSAHDLDPGQAGVAAQMDAAGDDWKAIARRLSLSYDLYDKKASERVRQKVGRLIHRGKIDEFLK